MFAGRRRLAAELGVAWRAHRRAGSPPAAPQAQGFAAGASTGAGSRHGRLPRAAAAHGKPGKISSTLAALLAASGQGKHLIKQVSRIRRGGEGGFDQKLHVVQGRERTNWLEFIRYAAVAIVSSPAVMWIGGFMYTYLWREEICMKELRAPGVEARPGSTRTQGHQHTISALQSYIESAPKQLAVVVGSNEVGKTTIMKEVLAGRDSTVHVELGSQPITCLSDLVSSFAKHLGIDYLGVRTLLTTVLPFAGGEIFVLKERLSLHDLKEALNVTTASLERMRRENAGGGSAPTPVVYIDGLHDNIRGWQGEPRITRDGMEALDALFAWSVYITKERQLAHVILGASPSFVASTMYTFQDIHSNMRFFNVTDVSLRTARKYLVSSMKARGRTLSDGDINLALETLGGRISDINKLLETLASGTEKSVREGLRMMMRHNRDRIIGSFSSHGQVPRGGGEEEESGDEESDEYLDPLKRTYSILTESHGGHLPGGGDMDPPWTGLDIWRAMKVLIKADQHMVPYQTMREGAFGGNEASLRALIDHDLLGCRMGRLRLSNDWDPDDPDVPKDPVNNVDSIYVSAYSPLVLAIFKELLEDPRISRAMELLEAAERKAEERAALQRRAAALEASCLEMRCALGPRPYLCATS